MLCVIRPPLSASHNAAAAACPHRPRSRTPSAERASSRNSRLYGMQTTSADFATCGGQQRTAETRALSVHCAVFRTTLTHTARKHSGRLISQGGDLPTGLHSQALPHLLCAVVRAAVQPPPESNLLLLSNRHIVTANDDEEGHKDAL